MAIERKYITADEVPKYPMVDKLREQKKRPMRVLTRKQLDWMRVYFPVMTNEDLAILTRLSLSTLTHIRRRYKLKKQNGFRYVLMVDAEKRRELERSSYRRPDAACIKTKQETEYVVVATKVCKRDYDKFTSIVTNQGKTKHEVLRSLILMYIQNIK